MITRDRAERIGRAHACETCGEYNYKRLTTRPSTVSERDDLGEAWHITKTCGVCGAPHEMGLDPDGEILYVT